MLDSYQRKIDYMRISITDRCHFQCAYCKSDHPQKLKHQDILSYEQLLLIVDQAIQLGINKFKITGGEPTIRKDYLFFIKELKKRENQIVGTAAQSPINIGKKAAETADNILDGNDYEKEVYEEVFMINKDNVDMYGTDGWQ